MEPESKWEWALLWALFILPAVAGCIIWIKQVEPVGFAYLAWLISAAQAVILMIEYHRAHPPDR
ncbi:hypothetical protein ACIBEJ_34115 [Nonomuraea sp. NPDC050790]|uniref:hypothetical protein n=1 Tax=Nonomuraea sp. NPDC050790 TaxID=3364371 RepID=UPI0037976E50